MAKQTVSKCKTCAKDFEHLASRERKFCSEVCSNGYRVQTQTCEWCGLVFHKQRNRVRYDHVFCSKRCYGDALFADSGFYGRTQAGNYADCAFRQGRTSCEGCGKEKRRFCLVVHHIDGDRKNNPIDGTNWEVLCGTCHIIRHLERGPNGDWMFKTAALTPRELIPGFYLDDLATEVQAEQVPGLAQPGAAVGNLEILTQTPLTWVG